MCYLLFSLRHEEGAVPKDMKFWHWEGSELLKEKDDPAGKLGMEQSSFRHFVVSSWKPLHVILCTVSSSDSTTTTSTTVHVTIKNEKGISKILSNGL